jgi:hypothetical protein
MKKMILGFILMILVASAGLGASVPGEKSTQFSLGGNLLMLMMEGGDSTFLVGAALRVDFNLGKSFILAPELSAGIGGWTAGGTLNFRSGKFFAGAGAVAVGAFEGGGSGEWGTNAFLKVHVGTKSVRTLLAASALVGDYIWGLGLTAAYIF